MKAIASTLIAAVSIALAAAHAQDEDAKPLPESITTLDGKTYEGIKTLTTETYAITITHASGAAKIMVKDLPESLIRQYLPHLVPGIDPDRRKLNLELAKLRFERDEHLLKMEEKIRAKMEELEKSRGIRDRDDQFEENLRNRKLLIRAYIGDKHKHQWIDRLNSQVCEIERAIHIINREELGHGVALIEGDLRRQKKRYGGGVIYGWMGNAWHLGYSVAENSAGEKKAVPYLTVWEDHAREFFASNGFKNERGFENGVIGIDSLGGGARLIYRSEEELTRRLIERKHKQNPNP